MELQTPIKDLGYGFLWTCRKNGPGKPLSLEKNRSYTIGTSAAANIRIKLADTTIRDEHCVLQVEENGVAVLINRAPLNPVLLNNKPVLKRKVLYPGDIISVGLKDFKYQNDNIKDENIDKISAVKNRIFPRSRLTLHGILNTPQSVKKRKSLLFSTKKKTICTDSSQWQVSSSSNSKPTLQEAEKMTKRILSTPQINIVPPTPKKSTEENVVDFSTPPNNTSIVEIETPAPKTPKSQKKNRKSGRKSASVVSASLIDLNTPSILISNTTKKRNISASVICLDTPDGVTPKSALKKGNASLRSKISKKTPKSGLSKSMITSSTRSKEAPTETPQLTSSNSKLIDFPQNTPDFKNRQSSTPVVPTSKSSAKTSGKKSAAGNVSNSSLIEDVSAAEKSLLSRKSLRFIDSDVSSSSIGDFKVPIGSTPLVSAKKLQVKSHIEDRIEEVDEVESPLETSLHGNASMKSDVSNSAVRSRRSLLHNTSGVALLDASSISAKEDVAENDKENAANLTTSTVAGDVTVSPGKSRKSRSHNTHADPIEDINSFVETISMVEMTSPIGKALEKSRKSLALSKSNETLHLNKSNVSTRQSQDSNTSHLLEKDKSSVHALESSSSYSDLTGITLGTPSATKSAQNSTLEATPTLEISKKSRRSTRNSQVAGGSTEETFSTKVTTRRRSAKSSGVKNKTNEAERSENSFGKSATFNKSSDFNMDSASKLEESVDQNHSRRKSTKTNDPDVAQISLSGTTDKLTESSGEVTPQSSSASGDSPRKSASENEADVGISAADDDDGAKFEETSLLKERSLNESSQRTSDITKSLSESQINNTSQRSESKRTSLRKPEVLRSTPTKENVDDSLNVSKTSAHVSPDGRTSSVSRPSTSSKSTRSVSKIDAETPSTCNFETNPDSDAQQMKKLAPTNLTSKLLRRHSENFTSTQKFTSRKLSRYSLRKSVLLKTPVKKNQSTWNVVESNDLTSSVLSSDSEKSTRSLKMSQSAAIESFVSDLSPVNKSRNKSMVASYINSTSTPVRSSGDASPPQDVPLDDALEKVRRSLSNLRRNSKRVSLRSHTTKTPHNTPTQSTTKPRGSSVVRRDEENKAVPDILAIGRGKKRGRSVNDSEDLGNKRRKKNALEHETVRNYPRLSGKQLIYSDISSCSDSLNVSIEDSALDDVPTRQSLVESTKNSLEQDESVCNSSALDQSARKSIAETSGEEIVEDLHPVSLCESTDTSSIIYSTSDNSTHKKSSLEASSSRNTSRKSIKTGAVLSGKRQLRNQNSPKNDLLNVSGVKDIFKASPRNRLSDLRGVKRLMQKSPENDLRSPKGVKKLLSTPTVPRSPRNDLTDVQGIEDIFATPKESTHPEDVMTLLSTPKSDVSTVEGIKRPLRTPGTPQTQPKHDLTDTRGEGKTLQTPEVQKSPVSDLTGPKDVKEVKSMPTPKNDLTNVQGVKRLLRTPRRQKEPENDLTKIGGIKKIFATPRPQEREPHNDLTNVKGVKRILRTPRPQESEPHNDLTNVGGVKRLLGTPRPLETAPNNDISDVRGVKGIFRTPKEQKSPRNDLGDVKGVKQLMSTPKVQSSPRNDLSDVAGVKRMFKTPKEQKSPLNDITSPKGIRKLMSTPKATTSPKNDITNVVGVKKMFADAERDARDNYSDSEISFSGLETIFDNVSQSKNELFDELLGGTQPVRTYLRKTMSPKKQPPLTECTRKSLGDATNVTPEVERWVAEQNKRLETTIESDVLTLREHEETSETQHIKNVENDRQIETPEMMGTSKNSRGSSRRKVEEPTAQNKNDETSTKANSKPSGRIKKQNSKEPHANNKEEEEAIQPKTRSRRNNRREVKNTNEDDTPVAALKSESESGIEEAPVPVVRKRTRAQVAKEDTPKKETPAEKSRNQRRLKTEIKDTPDKQQDVEEPTIKTRGQRNVSKVEKVLSEEHLEKTGRTRGRKVFSENETESEEVQRTSKTTKLDEDKESPKLTRRRGRKPVDSIKEEHVNKEEPSPKITRGRGRNAKAALDNDDHEDQLVSKPTRTRGRPPKSELPNKENLENKDPNTTDTKSEDGEEISVATKRKGRPQKAVKASNERKVPQPRIRGRLGKKNIVEEDLENKDSEEDSPNDSTSQKENTEPASKAAQSRAKGRPKKNEDDKALAEINGEGDNKNEAKSRKRRNVKNQSNPEDDAVDENYHTTNKRNHKPAEIAGGRRVLKESAQTNHEELETSPRGRTQKRSKQETEEKMDKKVQFTDSTLKASKRTPLTLKASPARERAEKAAPTKKKTTKRKLLADEEMEDAALESPGSEKRQRNVKDAASDGPIRKSTRTRNKEYLFAQYF